MTLRVLLPILFGLGGTALLVWLGLWQMQRLEWKESVLDQIEARIGAAPVAVPQGPDPQGDRYLPVRATGVVGSPDVLVQASRKGIGPGYRVIAPFTLEDGRRILIDRGFLRAADKTVPRPEIAMTLEGNLHWPEEIDGFTPDPDPAARLWYARDVDGLARFLDTEPLLVVVRATSVAQEPIMPLPVDTSGIPNDHLEYAVTWFGLAAVWLAMTGYFLRVQLRRPA